MYSANGNFYKNSHIIENMENDDNVNPFSTKDVQGVATSTGVQGVATSTGDQGVATSTGVQGVATSTGDQGKGQGKGKGQVGQGKGQRKGKGQVGQVKGQSNKTILIKMLAIDSKNTYLDYIEYLPIDTLTDFDMLENPFINNLSEAPLIKKIIEFNIFFNIMNSTQNATNNTFTVKTNKQVTFEYNYINDNNVFNITKIKLGNDDLSKEPTEHIFTIHIKPKTIIRCKLTVMPTINNNSGTPVIIINNLKTAIEQAGKLLI